MNDFTKEELEIIRHALRIDICKGGDYEGEKFVHKNEIRHNLAFDKIQSMIDNYCEHDWQPCLGAIHIETCHKCRMIR